MAVMPIPTATATSFCVSRVTAMTVRMLSTTSSSLFIRTPYRTRVYWLEDKPHLRVYLATHERGRSEGMGGYRMDSVPPQRDQAREVPRRSCCGDRGHLAGHVRGS